LEEVNTLSSLRAAGGGRARTRIISAWILLLAALLCAPALHAQGKGGKGRGAKGGQARAALAKAGRAPKGPAVGAAAPAGKAVPATGTAKGAKPSKEASESSNAASAAAWKRVVSPVIDGYYARHPDRAIERAWPEALTVGLGTFGSGATVRWRKTLADAQSELARLDARGIPRELRLEARALADWLDRELLLLECQTLPTSDPASYVRRALLSLRATEEAQWLPPEQRATTLASILGELGGSFREARICLLAPSPAWIELAARDLEDLREQVQRIERELPQDLRAKPQATKRGAPVPPSPLEAIDAFRAWLLERLPGAGASPPRLVGDEWPHLVQLVTGSPWKLNDLKVACLKDLARVEPVPGEPLARRKRGLDEEALAGRLDTFSSRALRFAQRAKVLPPKLKPEDVAFRLENSLREWPALVSGRPGGDVRSVFLELPHPSWSLTRAGTRLQAFASPAQQGVLGIRHGAVGEGLIARAAAADHRSPPMLLDQRLVREGAGLFALEWLPSIDWIENPYREDAGLRDEIVAVIGLEAARFVAALELHGEGLSFEEALAAFRRRTGTDAETARMEILGAERDPLHGVGYLGLLELRALSERLGTLVGPKKAIRTALLLLQRQPELRPSDLVSLLGARRPER